MRNFLAAVLSVIAVGVLLVAYGLLSARVAAADVYPSARPMLASERAGDVEDLTPHPFGAAQGPMAYRANDLRDVPAYQSRSAYERPRAVRGTTLSQREAPRRVVTAPKRD